jgi:O-antigen ligase
MTTSVSNAETSAVAIKTTGTVVTSVTEPAVYRIRHTLASRFLVLVVCIAIVLSTLAFGTVHYWAMGLFNLGALAVLILWVIDAWSLGHLRISRNLLQLPLFGAVLLGLIQLLPLRPAAADSLIGIGLSRSLSLDTHSTRLVIVQFATLLVYFSAVLVFIDTPRRLRLMVRTVIIFGFFLAVFGLTQSVTSPTKVYWFRELTQSTAFGPFINRHHFAGYMELTVAFPLGLLFAGAVDREKRLLYLFAAMLMGIALIMTASRGGVISLIAEVVFLVVISGFRRKERQRRSKTPGILGSTMGKIGLAAGLLVVLFLGVSLFGGDLSLTRLIDSVNTDDPTTGRAHFWSVTWNMIKAHPLVGTGLGAFGVIYTRFDTRSGFFRLEQAHNDYLQVLSDGGIVGAILAISFVVLLFRYGLRRLESRDDFRRGVALASLTGCFGVLVHSFFDFTLNTTANALLFLVLAGLATSNGRVEQASRRRRRSSAPGLEAKAIERVEPVEVAARVSGEFNSPTRFFPSDNNR